MWTQRCHYMHTEKDVNQRYNLFCRFIAMDRFLSPEPPPAVCPENPVMPPPPAVSPENPVMPTSPAVGPESFMMPRPKRRLPQPPAKPAVACPPKRSLPRAPVKNPCAPPKAKTPAAECGATTKPVGEMWGQFCFDW